MRTTRVISMALLLLFGGCGGKDKPTITMDVGDSGSGIETVDGGNDVCTPGCEGKECGDDGCGGDCGNCKFQLETCSEDGLCIPTPCESTKDCPGDLICNKELGQCAICVGDEDCPEGQTCGADHECHEEFLCQSDLDCKDHDLVCDKDAGKCVECLGTEDCKDEQYCLDSYCIDDVCTAGESHCDGLDVVTCNGEGSAEEITETCTDTRYCEEGECHAQVCPPGKLYCEDNLLHTCDPIGKEIIDTVDCEDDDKICYQGECVEQECEPDSTWCHDDFTAAACLEDGMSSTMAPCGADHYCEDGGCQPQVCAPGSVFCEGEVYKVCNETGSAIQHQENCAGEDQHCFNGACIDTECPPDQEFCEDDTTKALCAADGVSSTPEACPAEHYCDEGETVQCLPWVCTPAQAFCEDNTAKVCNSKGSAIINGIACGNNVCVGGACKPVICDANTSACDGNTVMQCDATGTVEQELEVCGDDQYCGEDGNAAACANQVCTPNAKTCQGTKVMECDEVGAELEEFKDCADDGEGCVDGECVEQVCGNGALDPGEACDDGNTEDGDGCSGECKVETMATVPEGAFWMGCNQAVDADCEADESPYHLVDIEEFSIDMTQVTVQAYEQCVDSGQCGNPSTPFGSCNWGKGDKKNHPMNCISWQEAKDYCDWADKRLCTEAEWEKAARGGCGLYSGACADAMPKYPWGNAPVSCDYANYYTGIAGCGTSSTWAVGTKPLGAGPYGNLDMVGNLWDWVEDCYHSTYQGAPGDGTAWNTGCENGWSLRGGSFWSYPTSIRSSSRHQGHIGVGGFNVHTAGLRCCKNP